MCWIKSVERIMLQSLFKEPGWKIVISTHKSRKALNSRLCEATMNPNYLKAQLQIISPSQIERWYIPYTHTPCHEIGTKQQHNIRRSFCPVTGSEMRRVWSNLSWPEAASGQIPDGDRAEARCKRSTSWRRRPLKWSSWSWTRQSFWVGWRKNYFDEAGFKPGGLERNRTSMRWNFEEH